MIITQQQTDLDRALAAWRETLGAEHVVAEPSALAAAGTATFSTTARVRAIIRPADRAEVQACLRIANAHNIALYPVSRGKNWGYGSRVPSQDGCVILDLGRLNRILDYHEKLAYVTLEPGVTFQQLHDFLSAQRSNLMLSATGGPADGSVIGNIVERGLGLGPYADHAQHVGDFEVVLPSGDLLRTGFGRFETPLAPLHAAGVGPQINGLFLQSSYGVVTRMTIWLAPKPEYFYTFYFSIQRPDHVAGLVDTLQRLRLAGPPGAQYSLWNDYKMLATLQQYPWQASGGRTPLPAEVLEQLRQRWDVRAWNGFGAIYSCSARAGRAERAALTRVLRGKVDELTFMSDTTARLARLLGRPLERLTGYQVGRATQPHARDASPWLGAPHDNLASTYWRKRTAIPTHMDPDADQCGIIWCSPCVPFEGRHATAACEIASRIIGAHQFEPNIALLCVAPRTINMIISIIFDRDVAGEDQRAMACHDALLSALIEQGYIPYRLGIQSMHALPPDEGADAFNQMLKRALDPNNILAPGRYSL